MRDISGPPEQFQNRIVDPYPVRKTMVLGIEEAFNHIFSV